MSEERNHFNTYCQQRYVAWVAECWMKNYYHLTRFKDFKFQVYIPNQKIILIWSFEKKKNPTCMWTLRKNILVQTLNSVWTLDVTPVFGCCSFFYGSSSPQQLAVRRQAEVWPLLTDMRFVFRTCCWGIDYILREGLVSVEQYSGFYQHLMLNWWERYGASWTTTKIRCSS